MIKKENIGLQNNKVVEVIPYDNWWDFTNQLEKRNLKNSIFRGHSNYYRTPSKEYHEMIFHVDYKKTLNKTITKLNDKKDGLTQMECKEMVNDILKSIREPAKINNNPDNPAKVDFKQYKTISSYNRIKESNNWSNDIKRYSEILKQKELYKENIQLYNHNLKMEEIDILTLLANLQHLGVSTPLIDFTRNPLTALYFSFCEINRLGLKSGDDGKGGYRFITIIEVKTDILKNYYDVEHLENVRHQDFQYGFGEHQPFLYLNPSAEANINLKKQEGCFIFLNSNSDLEFNVNRIYLEKHLFSNKEVFKPITWHIIPYASLGYYFSEEPKFDLFSFLLYHKKLGYYLFCDISALHYDSKNDRINFSCINNPDICNGLSKIKKDGEVKLYDKYITQ